MAPWREKQQETTEATARVLGNEGGSRGMGGAGLLLEEVEGIGDSELDSAVQGGEKVLEREGTAGNLHIQRAEGRL